MQRTSEFAILHAKESTMKLFFFCKYLIIRFLSNNNDKSDNLDDEMSLFTQRLNNYTNSTSFQNF